MYAKNDNYVTYFKEESAPHTEKLIYGKVSEAIKLTDEQIAKNGDGNKYIFESWSARFVGKAKEKIQKLENKTSIKLTEWNARCPYDKEKKRSNPYLLILDFEIVEAKA